MRIFLIIFAFLFGINLQVFANSTDWDNYVDLDKPWEVQKPVTNQDYDKVVEVLEQKKEKIKQKNRKKMFKRISGGGTSLHKELNPDNQINEIDSVSLKEDLLLNIPVNLIIDGKVLEKGYYKVIAEKDKDNNIIIYLYQSQYLVASFNATETEDDFEQERIDFVEISPFNDSFMKLIFGSLDFNAYTYLPYLND